MSDATGNRLTRFHKASPSRPEENIFVLTGSLWPDEAAWRVKLDLKRASGYPDSNVVTFTNLPPPPARSPAVVCLTNLVGGIPIRLKILPPPAGRLQPDPPTSWRSNRRYPSSGWTADIVEITADPGATHLFGTDNASLISSSVLLQSIPANVKFLNVKCVVQKLRSVEFFVEPPKPE